MPIITASNNFALLPLSGRSINARPTVIGVDDAPAEQQKNDRLQVTEPDALQAAEVSDRVCTN